MSFSRFLYSELKSRGFRVQEIFRLGLRLQFDNYEMNRPMFGSVSLTSVSLHCFLFMIRYSSSLLVRAWSRVKCLCVVLVVVRPMSRESGRVLDVPL